MSDRGQQDDEIEIDPERVAGWLESDPALQVIDVREPYEREAGHIAGTRHIELVNLTAEASTVERDASGGVLLPRRARARRWPRRRFARLVTRRTR